MGDLNQFLKQQALGSLYSVQKIELSVFETTIRFIGAILTLYSFTGDPMYRDKAVHIADKMLPAFKTPTGIPHALINVYTGDSKNYAWASGSASILSELGTLHLEFVYLSDVTGNPIYREKVEKIRSVISSIEKPNGLYPNYLNPKTGHWGQSHISMGALGDSFYEYLLKAWIQSNKEDTEGLKLFDDAMAALMTHTMRRSQKKGLLYFSDMKLDRLEHKMDHLGCFSGGMFGLAAHTRPNSELFNKYMDVAKGITNTCHEAYIQTATHIGSCGLPNSIALASLDNGHGVLSFSVSQNRALEKHCGTEYGYTGIGFLTSDFESFYMALEKHCRTEYGYTGIKNVYQENPQQDDVQQSFFLAETLKYLYLLFSDDSLLPLDQWVFNSEGHPLPVKGKNDFYREASSDVGAAPISR
ncbi:mannosyl-oligosaccharide alpha-1,2-mannosidase IA-like [Diaphorina citri]|uniref:alpha-1,2-Mannosidase n=1 Tax=Diaphorina citri TaxID=121845 RepID=A0A3Q0ILH9_DIACI|nr:mannosyl-oligosaccharide alpha-1,2-mannosidase IA-like [Diaphorina citri]